MPLPQETIDNIKANAAKATNKRDDKLRGGSKDYVRRISFLDGYEEGHNAGATEWAGKADGDAFIRGYACCVTCIIKGHGISTEVEEAFKAGIGSLQRCIDANCDEYDIEVLNKYFK